ncbi:hypothetical protein F5Y13DRAFT_174712 [Hypoxylon sp. FL1857]|nr:hypothetical protein F5Y13DRAFT_174712 [Hypoxylon sp. FL1857]
MMEKDRGNDEKNVPKDGKGKGVATQLDISSPSSAGQNGHPGFVEAASLTTSVISRLGASASQLADNMLRHPSSAHIADALPSSKAESSRAAQGGGGSEASTYKSAPTPATFDGTFRSTERGRYTPGESNFSSFLDSTSMLEDMEPRNLDKQDHEQGNDLEPGQMSRGAVIMADDGMDVVDFLDSRYGEVEDTAVSLTDDERVALRYRLFENGATSKHFSQRNQWEDILNFFPDMKPDSNGIQEYADLLGTSDLEEARSIWINQWQSVLSSYTDEVWGDLSPLVNAARGELASLSGSREASPSKPKALRRLQQILHHVRGD